MTATGREGIMVLDIPVVVRDLLEPNLNMEEMNEDEDVGTTAGLSEAARSLSTAALTWYAIAFLTVSKVIL